MKIKITNNMKQKSLILAAIAVIAAVSCTPKVSDKTAVSGVFETEAPENVNIVVPSAGFDTTVVVKDGKFSVTIPVCLTDRAMVSAGNVKAHFIADGTPLKMTFKEDKTVEFVSKHPEISLETKMEEYDNALKGFQNATQAKLDSIKVKQGPESDSLIDEYYENVKAASLKVIAENKGNVLTLKALNNLRGEIPDVQMDSIMNTLDSSLNSMPSVKSIKAILVKKLATAEGKMFTDFEVEGSKLSDYVGKGKYMLVDFWASWCGPCKKEIPNIKNVYDKYAGNDFDVLSVAVWDKKQSSIDTAKVYGVTWNEINGNSTKVPTDIYGIEGIPHIILFGPDGTILKRDLRGEEIETEVAKNVQPKK